VPPLLLGAKIRYKNDIDELERMAQESLVTMIADFGTRIAFTGSSVRTRHIYALRSVRCTPDGISRSVKQFVNRVCIQQRYREGNPAAAGRNLRCAR
jgi:hypothetical protein